MRSPSPALGREREGPMPCYGHGRVRVLPLAEELAALRFRRLRRLDDLHHHRLGGHGEVADDRVGDVLDQAALLLERAALEGVDDDLWHDVTSQEEVEKRYSVRERKASPGRRTVLGNPGSFGEFGKCWVSRQSASLCR